MRNEGTNVSLGDTNDGKTTNQAIFLRNDSNSNAPCLCEDLVLASNYKRNFEDLVENLFGTELIKLHCSQDIIIYNSLLKYHISNQISFSLKDYLIYNIHVYNQMVNFDMLNNHEPDSNHGSPNFVMLKIPIEEHR